MTAWRATRCLHGVVPGWMQTVTVDPHRALVRTGKIPPVDKSPALGPGAGINSPMKVIFVDIRALYPPASIPRKRLGRIPCGRYPRGTTASVRSAPHVPQDRIRAARPGRRPPWRESSFWAERAVMLPHGPPDAARGGTGPPL